MDKETIKKVKNILATPKKIVIVGHKNPDGDAIGSCVGLQKFLQKTRHNAVVIMPNEFPDFLKWLPGIDTVMVYEKEVVKTTQLIEEADLIFTLDFNALNRTGDVAPLLEKATCPFIMIDHHQAPDEYALVTYSDTTMSSTCEMVYHFIDALDGEQYMDPHIATLLYTGIMTDTGSFRFAATTATTHRVIAQLIDYGATNFVIHQNIYDVNTPSKMKLLGVALKNLTLLKEFNTAYITLSQQELDDNHFKKGDTGGFVNYALSLEGVVFAVIFIENKQENIVKMSLRSKGQFSVNEFARNHYNGGGHTNAAGGRSLQNLEDTVSEFISILPSYKNQLK